MQDRATIEIGKWQLESLTNQEPYQLYVEDMFPKKDSYKMILLVFDVEQEGEAIKISYRNNNIAEVSKKNYAQFAYRKGAARGGDVTFTTKLNSVDKKLNTLYINQLPKLLKVLQTSTFTEEFSFFTAFKVCLDAHIEEIKTSLQAKFEEFDKKIQQAMGVSVKFMVDGKEKYLGDFEVVKQIILAHGTEGKSSKYGVVSEGKNSQCSVCLKEKEKLHGFGSPFKYASVDKKGLVSGFFNQKNNWKNYPICPECALAFEMGQKYIVNNLNKYFYGKNYYMIPKTIFKNSPEKLEEAILILTDLKYSEKGKNSIKSEEDFLMESIGEAKNSFSLNLLFFEENPTTKAIKIKLMLEEIMPSRFNTLFNDIPAIVNKHSLYEKAITIKKEKKDLVFRFALFKDFFADSFFSIVQKVFLGQSISKETLYAKIMNVIRQNYNKSRSSSGYVEYTYLTVLKAHLLINYLQQLNLIDYNKNFNFQPMEQNTEKKKRSFDMEKLHKFIKENENFFDEDYKVGIFSVGILVRLLLNIQQQSLGNTPFEKRLRGYHLNPEILQKVYVEALGKISVYQNFYTYQEFKAFTTEYFNLNINKLSQISNNELSLYFVSGLELGSRFKRDKEDTKKQEN